MKTGISGSLVVKSKLPTRSGSSLEAVEPLNKKFLREKEILVDMKSYLLSQDSKFWAIYVKFDSGNAPLYYFCVT